MYLQLADLGAILDGEALLDDGHVVVEREYGIFGERGRQVDYQVLDRQRLGQLGHLVVVLVLLLFKRYKHLYENSIYYIISK